jgi:ADP-ribose pyrophosphatase YjhB (NUDIX family)
MPQKNLWTVPAGFLEVGESTAAGAARETLEEAGAKIEILAPYVHYDIVGIGQAYLLFRVKLAPPPYTFDAVRCARQFKGLCERLCWCWRLDPSQCR